MRTELDIQGQCKESIGCLFPLSLLLEGHVALKDRTLPATRVTQLGVNLQNVPMAIYLFPSYWQGQGDHSLAPCALCLNPTEPCNHP